MKSFPVPILLLFFLGSLFNCKDATAQKTENLIIVTLDGFRWEDLYRGADSALISSRFTSDKDEIRKNFGGNTLQERRSKLLPFFWSTMVNQGQLYGNVDLGNSDMVANPYLFSYPGYNEIFTGFPDPKMNTNDPITNPNMNVLEYINRQKGFQGRVAIFSSWERFPQILNMNRSGLLVNSGYADFIDIKSSDRLKYINRFQHEVPKLLGDSTRLDFLTYEMANEYFKEYKPRVMYLSFDETDDFAHEGHYDMYLKAAHQEDAFLKELWEKIQLDPQYKDKTTLLITCDHGRGTGDATKDRWTDHGTETPKSVQTWFAVIGPDSPSLGEVKNTTTTYHKQLAQTMSKLLGLDFKSAAGHEVGDPVSTVFKP